MGRDIGTGLCKYQDHQDYWPIIHDKLEDLFTRITHSFQDIFHPDKCAYRYKLSSARKCATPLIRRYWAKLTCEIHKNKRSNFLKIFQLFMGFWIFWTHSKTEHEKIRSITTSKIKTCKRKKHALNRKQCMIKCMNLWS